MRTAEMKQAFKKYGNQVVLDDISFYLESGKILGLIGPSGAGKTTTIKALLGMEQLDRGASFVLGQKMPNREVLAHVEYMGQEDALYNELTAAENLRFFGTLMGLKHTQLEKAGDHYLELLKLSDFKQTLVKNFSGGMKRRLTLAITLQAEPQLLVLDEPTVGIDPALRLEIWDQLRTIAQTDRGILITTHVMDEAERCDLLGLIIGGKLFAFGTPAALKNQFAAKTIEEVFLKAEVRSDAL
ncbi:ABC transporter ATP-binding protein [Enterococcus sp. CSURQ0835]|uniref:ABC transporter ATP-binding protein n=1 Tax=Enterococcus sp. CSURQ0835 TaxID=2681394 RepID=UPI00135BCB6E|nr:ABC transporter ATP-binding protein [Enterococcus sp. CSURQ0835]